MGVVHNTATKWVPSFFIIFSLSLISEMSHLFLQGPLAIQSINRFFGRADSVRIGVYQGDDVLDPNNEFEKDNEGGYIKALSTNEDDNKFPSAVEVFKEILETCIESGDKITIVSIGFLTNLRAILLEAHNNGSITYDKLKVEYFQSMFYLLYV